MHALITMQLLICLSPLPTMLLRDCFANEAYLGGFHLIDSYETE